jgi:RHS repeat-associated protein
MRCRWGNREGLSLARVVSIALVLAGCLLLPHAASALGLDEIFMDMDTASYSDVRSEASNQTQPAVKPVYPNAPVSIPFYVTFDGYFVPASNDTKVAVFSDDGVDLYVDDIRVLNKKDVGQALPSLDNPPNPSLIPLNLTWVGGKVYKIRVEYSNICYTGALDIDGCTLFAYNGGGSIFDSFVDLHTDSNNDKSIDDEDQPIEEDSPGRYVCRNIDDDNSNSTADKYETGTVTGEDDLVQVNLAYGPSSGINGHKITLQASSGGTKIKVWTTAEKGTEITLPKTYVIGTDAVPSTIWVEGVDTGEAMLDAVIKKSDDTVVMTDKVKFTVVADCAPPTFTVTCVSPAAAKCGDTVTIHFTSSETLLGNPEVTIDDWGLATFVSKSGNDYTYTYTLDYWEPRGEATIHISGYDLDNNFGEVTEVEALWIVDCYGSGDCSLGSFTYDRNGNRKTMCDSRGITLYFYDVMSRLVKVVEPDGKWIEYEYDANGNRTKMKAVLDGSCGQITTQHVTQYEYNDRGLLSKMTDQLGGVTTYTYTDNGLVDTITYPNGTKAIHTYNERGWLTCVSNRKSDDTVIAEFTYSYDPTYWGKNGTRTRVIENILKPDGSRISAQVDYEYDDLYRLVHEHRIAYNGGDPGVAYEYNFAYDAAGNRTQLADGRRSSTISYTYDAANKMLTAGNSTFTYDDAGNTLTETNGSIVTAYTWDYLNRLTQWSKTGHTTQSYVYNADGMRVRVTPSGGTATNFLLDGGEIAEEITGANIVSNIGPRNTPIIRIAVSGRTIYAADAVGSTRAITDASQVVAEAGVYDAYGTLLVDYPTSSAPRYGFAGTHHYYQDSTGLQYLKYRYYDPATGRFITADPVRYGSNHYAYAGNLPTVMVDPLGLFPGLTGCLIGGGIGLIGGIIGGGGIADTACRTGLSCLAGGLAEIVCESSGGVLCKCAIGAAGAIAGAGITALCSQLGKCPKPFNWKCAAYSAGVGALTGCAGKWVTGDAIEDIMMKVMLKLFGMDIGSACNNSYPVTWPPTKGF